MRSLARGLAAGSPSGLPLAVSPGILGGANTLGRATVTLNGQQETMFALALRVTYPAGTCLEHLVVFSPSSGFPPSACTRPLFGLLLALWQTTSGSRAPDRLILISADAGTTTFGELGGPSFVPSSAILLDRDEKVWASVGGTLTSQVTPTSQTCAVPPPPFAISATCNIAMFEESGSIVFEEFLLDGLDRPGIIFGPRVTLEIPRQTIPGILQAITEIRPITVP